MKAVAGKKGNKFKLGSILFFVILFLILYIPSLFHWALGKSIGTDIITMGTIEDSINADGVIIRDEEVLNSPFSGNLNPLLKEGDKAAAGSEIAAVLKNSSAEAIKGLKTLELRIIKIQKEKADKKDLFSQDVAKIDRDISSQIRKIALQSSQNKLIDAFSGISEVDDLVRKKASIIGNLSGPDENLKQLKREKENLQKQVNECTQRVVSNSSGIISYHIDGYETLLTPGSINTIKPDLMDKIKAEKAPGNTGSFSVEANKPFAKVIRDINFYVVGVVAEKYAGSLKNGQEVGVRVNDAGITVKGNVYSVSHYKDKAVVAIMSNEGLSNLMDFRSINFDIIKNDYSGLKVPLGSLKNYDSKKKTAEIMLVKADFAQKRQVTVKGCNNDFAVINGIINMEDYTQSVKLYDIYIINPKNISEGQLISK